MQRDLDRMARAVRLLQDHRDLTAAAYVLITPLRKFTSALPSSGEAMVLLQPGEAREAAQAIRN